MTINPIKYKYINLIFFCVQIPTPIYEFTKIIKQLITPYLPRKHDLKSTHELMKILHIFEPYNGILASLDVENLFTNVPVNETIDIILNNIYNNL